ncbi:MAG: cupin domain-containing protein [Proteobacteria bacterium]|nr:cupin domain-containing protein [Pseudomonadota bacterium]
MSDAATIPSPVRSTQEHRERLAELARETEPTVFNLRAQLPIQGRTDTLLAATEQFTVVLKTYASGGENTLHAHPNEDHTFVVMQGAVRFHGKDGEIDTLRTNQGILIPAGALYWFEAISQEQLVMLRVGTRFGDAPDGQARVNLKGAAMDPFTTENKQVDVILSDEYFG